MGSTIVIAQQSGYWMAGISTVVAAIVVTVVILMSSRSDNDNAP